MAVTPPEDEINPYAAPKAIKYPEGSVGSDDPLSVAVRTDHLRQEAAVRALGLSCYLYGFFWAVLAVPAFLDMTTVSQSSEMHLSLWPSLSAIGGVVVFMIALLWLIVALGRGLRRLMPCARWSCVVVLMLLLPFYLFAVIGTWRENVPLASVGFALYMVSFGSALWMLLSPSTARIFAPVYRKAVSRSPSLTPRLGIGSMVALSLFVGGTALIVLAAIRSWAETGRN